MSAAGRAWGWAAAATVAVALALAFIDPYGTLNQATYLLDPLRRAMPELYRNDWFVAGTPPYLPVWGWIAAWLFRLDPEGAVAVLAAHVVVMLAIYAAIAWLAAALTRDPRDARVFVIVAAVTAVTMGRTLGGNYLVTGYLQPSSLATAGWLFAMAALVRRRYLLCGVTLAVAGFVHVNFLVLGFGLFALAALVGRDATRKELVLLVAPQLAVLAYFAADLRAAAGPTGEAVRILLEFHAPGHYAAGRLARNLPALAAWQLAAFAALPLLAPVAREARMLWRFSLVVLAICVVTTLLIAMPALASLTQARWSRIAPFGQLACQVLVVAALIRHAAAPGASRARRIAVAGATALAIALGARLLHAAPLLAAAAIAGVVAVLALPARPAHLAASAIAAIAVAVALWRSPRGTGLTTLPAGSDGERELASWVRRETSPDAVFLAPPDMMRFRLFARRAVVVDTKSPPLQPALLVAWYRRLCAMVDVADAPTHEWVERRYDQLTASQRERVARAFGAAYIVVVAATAAMPGPPAYANAEYAVYRTPR